MFKPYAAAQAVGGEPLNPEATDFVMRLIRGIWKHHGITSVLVAEALTEMPGYLDRIDAWIAAGVLGADSSLPNAADLQIGATIALLQTIGDIRPMIAGRPCERLASLTPAREGLVPAGAFPEHWMP
jgi:glutathione S-transferase